MRGLLLIFFFISSGLGAQNSDVFYANASSLEVVEGTSFNVDFIVNNVKISQFRAPNFKNFQVVSGPSQTSSYSNVNGKVSQEFSYRYVLQANKVGKLTIKAATCVNNGKILSTEPLTIEVIKRDAKSLQSLGLPTDEDIFVRLELSTDTAYMGEKVELSYKLYTRKEVRSFDIKKEDDYDGFFVRPKASRDKNSKQEEIDGKQYRAQILEKRMLYPQQTGVFDFSGASVTLGLPDPNRPGSGFFFNRSGKSFPVKTNDGKLVVVDLPNNAPASFSGAVGRYRMSATVDKQKLSTDDAITLKMTVAGNGDAKYILPASQEHLEDFELYDPNIIEKGEREMFGEIQTIKEFDYLLVPLKAGRQSLQARFTYFDTDRNEYITLKSQVMPLMVEQGSVKRNVELVEREDSDRALSGPMEKLAIRKKRKDLFGGPIHLSLLGIAFLGIGMVFWKKRQIDIEAGIDPTLKKRNKAKAIAEKRLSKAEELMKLKSDRAFYEEISRSLLGFIADKLNVPNSEISKSNVAAKLKGKQVEEDQIATTIDLITKCEVAVFAGKRDGNLEEIYSSTKNLIAYLSEKI